jgi:hypothetical protein
VAQQENIQTNIKSFQDAGYSNDTKMVMGNSKAIAYLQAKIDTTNAKKTPVERDYLPPIKTWTVSEFIKRHDNDIEGNSIFENCYDPVTGIREFLTNAAHAFQAADICEILKKELIIYMSEENARKVILKYDKIKEDMIDYTLWEPVDTILGLEILETEEKQQYRGTKRQKNSNTKANTSQKSYAAAASGTRQQNNNSNRGNQTMNPNKFHPSPNGIMTPPTHDVNKRDYDEQTREGNQLKKELQKSITDLKQSQTKFEQFMLDRQTKYEMKLDKVTSNIQKDLTITNKNMSKIHTALKTHVTEEFLDLRLTAMNHLTNCFQTAMHQSRSQSVAEEPREYMHIEGDDDSSKRKLNSLSPLDNRKKTGKENNGIADKNYP